MATMGSDPIVARRRSPWHSTPRSPDDKHQPRLLEVFKREEMGVGHVRDLDALAGGRGLLRAHAHLVELLGADIAIAASALTAADLTDWMIMAFPR